MKRRIGLVVAAAALAAMACGSAAGAGPIARPSIQVTTDRGLTRTHEGPFLLVDRTNRDTVYLSEAELQTGQCRFYTSNDRGATWARGASPNLPPFNCSPGTGHPQSIRTHLAQASDGTLLYAFAGNDPAAGSARSILLGRSSDRGRTWQTAPVHVAPAVTPETFGNAQLNYQAHVAVDPANPKSVFVIWRRAYPNFQGRVLLPNRSWMASSSDGGATFGAATMAFDKDTSSDSPFPFFAGGRLNVAYVQAFPRPATGAAPPNEVHFASSTDLGRTWSDTKVASANFADGPNAVYDAGARTFSLVWDDNRNGEFDAFYASSKDGSAWTAPRQLNDDPKRIKGHLFPTLGLASGGRLDVAWYDFRNDPYPPDSGPFAGDQGRRGDVYSTSSTDGGRSWSPNLRVNDLVIDRTKGIQNSQFSFFVPLAVASGPDWTLVAWSDTRNGDGFSSTQDIFSGQVAFKVPAARGDGVSLPVVLGIAAAGGLAGGAGIALIVAVLIMRRRQTGMSGTARA